MILSWEEIKQAGQQHYKTNGVENIDLYKALGILQDWCVGEIMSKAARNRKELHTIGTAKCIEDMDEIIHSAEMIKTLADEMMKKKNSNLKCYSGSEPRLPQKGDWKP